MNRRICQYIGPYLRMPWWLFWAFLSSITWFYVVRRIIDWDLWWHMAAGNYLMDHHVGSAIFHWKTWIIGGEYLQSLGIYPDASAFTFSPVTTANFVSRTWLGDIIFHEIYNFGGFYALQVFRGTMILIPVLLMLHLTRWKHNIWTLLIAAMMIIGTMQKHLCKNAIVALPFMSFICWAWIQARYHGKTKWLWSYPFLFLFWSHFHGEVIVGATLLTLIVAGEIFDSVILPQLRHITWKNLHWIFNDLWVIALLLFFILVVTFTPWTISVGLILMCLGIASLEGPLKPFFKNSESKRSSWKFIVVLLISWILSLTPVQIIWSLPTESVVSCLAKFIPSLRSPSEVLHDQQAQTQNKATSAPKDIKAKLRTMMRTVFTGPDADNVAEYQWPFEILYVLAVKCIFVLFVLYFVYLFFRIFTDWKNLSLAMEFPNIALLYMSLGYLRTVSFTFVVTLPFMAYSLYRSGQLPQIQRSKMGKAMLGLCLLLILGHFASDLFKEFNHLFYNCLGYAQYFATPFLVLPIIFGVIFLISKESIFLKSIRYLSLAFSLYTLGCLGAFAYFENKTYQEGNFHGVTGFIDTEPGLGKSNKFFDGMADYVTEKLPPQKNIYNTYNMGGYLQWKWYGKRKVFIDGRSAIFEAKFYQAYIQNNAQEYVQQNDFEHALINLVVDRDRLIYFLQQGWTPIVYDSASTVLQRPKTNLEDVYGIVPQFQPGERSIAELENYDRELLANFINATIHHMMLFGRIKDGKAFMTQAVPVIDQIPNDMIRQQLIGRKTQVEQFANAFGDINHRALGQLSRQIFENIQGVPYFLAMADAYYALQQWPQAEANYFRAYQLKNNDKNIMLRLGETAYLQNKHDQALQAYQEALKLDNKDPRILPAAMLPLLAQKNYDKVIALGTEALKLNANAPQVYYHLGCAYFEKGDKAKARELFAQCLTLKPDFQVAIDKIKECDKAPASP